LYDICADINLSFYVSRDEFWCPSRSSFEEALSGVLACSPARG
jgi:hypothetical protein